MPIYEYRCTKCGNELEVMQKFTDPAPPVCPKCAAENTLEKLVSRTSFQLKGGGWYSDLYGSVKKDSASASTPGTGGASTGTAPAAPAASTASAAPAAASSAPSSSGSSGSGTSGGGSSSGGSSSGSSGS